MPKLNEVIDSLNNENAEELKETLKAEALAQEKRESQLYSRAKKAEGFEKKEGKWVKKEVKETKPEAPDKTSEPDYARKIDLLTLKSEGYSHPDDQKLVLDEAMRLKLPVEEILTMEYIKSKLTMAKDQREAREGMPKDRGKAGGQSRQDVDYWLAKGETPDDQELAEKVIEARIAKESKANKFSDELFTG